MGKLFKHKGSEVLSVKLKVKLVRGSDLPVSDLASSDPYVKLTASGETRQSTVKKGTLNPVWDEVFTFPFASYALLLSSALTAEVFDHDRLGYDDELCETETLELASVTGLRLYPADPGEKIALPLRPKTGGGGKAPMLTLVCDVAFDSKEAKEAAMNHAMRTRTESELGHSCHKGKGKGKAGGAGGGTSSSSEDEDDDIAEYAQGKIAKDLTILKLKVEGLQARADSPRVRGVRRARPHGGRARVPVRHAGGAGGRRQRHC